MPEAVKEFLSHDEYTLTFTREDLETIIRALELEPSDCGDDIVAVLKAALDQGPDAEYAKRQSGVIA